ncbi:hypothetical protein CDAR_496861 [Caerostris darwini]|uniref:Uncharacterized protein n=1 Tax=Caerostris darwini TaxID=1538125 RepID=A0AAV4U580_9ARAC|nr:hypothetical protein CDAR_496861 [Caerostris darwini]
MLFLSGDGIRFTPDQNQITFQLYVWYLQKTAEFMAKQRFIFSTTIERDSVALHKIRVAPPFKFCKEAVKDSDFKVPSIKAAFLCKKVLLATL